MSELNITVSSEDIINAIDLSDLVSQLDGEEIWDIAKGHIDYDDLAVNVAEYIDLSSQIEDHLRYNESDAITQDGLYDLMSDYRPGNHCSLGDKVTETIAKGNKFMIYQYLDNNGVCSHTPHQEFLDALVSLIKSVNAQTQVAVTSPVSEDTNVVAATTDIIAATTDAVDTSVVFNFDELSKIFYLYANNYNHYVTYTLRNHSFDQFNAYFKESIRLVITGFEDENLRNRLTSVVTNNQ